MGGHKGAPPGWISEANRWLAWQRWGFNGVESEAGRCSADGHCGGILKSAAAGDERRCELKAHAAAFWRALFLDMGGGETRQDRGCCDQD